MRFRHLVFLTFFVFLPGVSWASCTGSGMTWTCTANSTAAQINTAIGSASEGATITFGAGSGSWSSTVTITKGIHLIGAGSSSTIITSSGANPMLRIFPANQSLNSKFEISGFAFNTANRAIAIALGKYNYQPTTLQTNVKIHDNSFSGTTSANSDFQYIMNYNMGGVVYRNMFAGRDQHIRSVGYGDQDIFRIVPSWYNKTGYSYPQALYIEDNVFTMSAPDGSYIADCQYGGVRRVWRYNTITVNNDVSWSGFIDWHGYNAENYTSCIGDIIYGNKGISNTNENWGWAAARGGKGLIFYNDVTTSGNVSGGIYYQGGTQYSICPPKYADHQYMRTYIWANRKNNSSWAGDSRFSPPPYRTTCDGGQYPIDDRQVFNFKPSFNGTSGVGCGTLAQMQAISTCTDRTAFWVTTQGCSNLSNLTGDIVSYPNRSNISGTLYVCQSNSWVELYTPYTYPHPLRTGARSANRVYNHTTASGDAPGRMTARIRRAERW